jgi:L-arabinose isomerase
MLLGSASPLCSVEPGVTLDVLEAWAEMVDFDYVHLTENTSSEELIKELRVNDLL